MELHKGINAMKDDISKLREENANIVKSEAAVVPTGGADAQIIDGFWIISDLKSRLESSKKKLKDTSLLLQQTDAKNFDLSMNSYDVLILPLTSVIVW